MTMREHGVPGWRDPGDMGKVSAEALAALSDVRSWTLAEDRWNAIQQILATMADAVESGNTAALMAATTHLELAGPMRIIAIGTTKGPPPLVRDLLNNLVHALGGFTADQSALLQAAAARKDLEQGAAGAADADSHRG